MFKKGFIMLLVLLMVSALLVAGCGQEEEAGESQVVIALWSAPEGLFNFNLLESVYDDYSCNPVFVSLMRYDPDNGYVLVPELAESMEISDDNLTITFVLRDDAYFHDGEKVTTEDVKWTFEWMCHPDYTGVRGSMWEFIEGYKEFHGYGQVDEDGNPVLDAEGNQVWVEPTADELTGIEIVDEREIKFHLTQIDAPSLTQIATWAISPKHVFEGTPIADLETHPAITQPIGAGPFKFVRYEEGQFTEMEAFDDFYRGRPELDRIIVKVITAEVAQAEALTGQADIVWVQPNAEDFAMFEEGGLNIHAMPANAYQYMGMKLDHPILGDKNVRHAITYALDRGAMVENLFDGMALQQVSHMSSVSWAYDPEIKPLPFDPDKAAELLDEAGWVLGDDGVRYKDGKPLELTLSYPTGNPTRMRNAEIIQQLLSDVGIKINLDIKEFATLTPQVYDEQAFDLYLMGWSLALEPDPSGIWLSTDAWNAVGFNHPDNDRLIYAGRSTLNQEDRYGIYQEWQNLLVEEAPYVWFYAEKEAWVSNPRVKNFRPDSFGLYWDVWRWSVE